MDKVLTLGQQQNVDKNLGTNLYWINVVCECAVYWMLSIVLVCSNSCSVNHLK